MIISVAQTRPHKGDIDYNIRQHLDLIDVAISAGAEVMIFPELSLTGYEPKLAKALAMELGDSRCAVFQDIADSQGATLVIGAPIRYDTYSAIGALIFRRNQKRGVYYKNYLDPDEETYFRKRHNESLLIESTDMALAICYEISIEEHVFDASIGGATMYLASVAKSKVGTESAVERLSLIAKEYGMITAMANSVGPCDNFESAGTSSIWDDTGRLVGQLDDKMTGVLLYDTDTHRTSSYKV